MSREYGWDYRIHGPDHQEKWEAFFGFYGEDTLGIHGIHVRHVPTGGSDLEGSRIFVWANRAKARRLKRKLDVIFDQDGELELWYP